MNVVKTFRTFTVKFLLHQHHLPRLSESICFQLGGLHLDKGPYLYRALLFSFIPLLCLCKFMWSKLNILCPKSFSYLTRVNSLLYISFQFAAKFTDWPVPSFGPLLKLVMTPSFGLPLLRGVNFEWYFCLLFVYFHK